MENGFTLSEVFNAKPSEIYRAWLNSDGHSAMTGSPAKVNGKIGGEFSAWDGYITGTTQKLTPDQHIVQAWRTSEFADEVPDSHLEILLEKVDGGTRVTITHSDMPEDQVDGYKQGWEDFYFKPMREYFNK